MTLLGAHCFFSPSEMGTISVTFINQQNGTTRICNRGRRMVVGLVAMWTQNWIRFFRVHFEIGRTVNCIKATAMTECTWWKMVMRRNLLFAEKFNWLLTWFPTDQSVTASPLAWHSVGYSAGAKAWFPFRVGFDLDGDDGWNEQLYGCKKLHAAVNEVIAFRREKVFQNLNRYFIRKRMKFIWNSLLEQWTKFFACATTFEF